MRCIALIADCCRLAINNVASDDVDFLSLIMEGGSNALEKAFRDGLIPEDHTFLGVYRFELPEGTDDRTIRLVGQGLFFENDWAADDTCSFIGVE